jgi:exosortase/archaeosortase family protein
MPANAPPSVTSPESGSISVFRLAFLALLLTLVAIVADQLAAPILRTSSPLWAAVCLLALIWRRGEFAAGPARGFPGMRLSPLRVMFFTVLHVVLVFAARVWLQNSQGAMDTAAHLAWSLTALKFTVLLPTLALLPLASWKSLGAIYRPEFAAAFVVLVTYLPRRIMDTLWPWYGQALGHFVFLLSWPFVHPLGYVRASFPTLTGPALDVTIALTCSGFDGIKLFDYLFGFVVLCDWNRLSKGRTLVAYFGGAAAMLLGNALRIVFMVVLGNRGFTDFVARFHLSAGWMFFSAAFLVYLSLVYRWMLLTPHASAVNPKTS